jgi:hypothetical protein
MLAHRAFAGRAGGLATAAVVAGLLLLAARGASAQQAVLTNSRPLDFGRFVARTGGTVTVSPSGVRGSTGGVVLLNSPGAGAAVFNVSKANGGATNKAVAITLPADGSTSLTSATGSMPLKAFVTSPAVILTVPAGGVTLSVGATMTVAPNQPRGNYTGSIPLIVNFQ